MIATERLIATTGRGMARAHGVPDFPFAVIEHPIDSISSEAEVRAKAEQAIEQVISILTGAV